MILFHNIIFVLVKKSQSFIRLGFFFKNNYKKVFLLTKCLLSLSSLNK